MLQTNEVDDDYFTPISSTSLANIFGNSNRHGKETENESLKYTPPKVQNITQNQKTVEEAKATECIFACALFGHEWTGDGYSATGKLGFAILKVKKNDSHNIVLYDSNKTTLSNTTITENLEVTIKENIYISYYDNLSKYWSVYGTEEEIKKIVDLLQKLNANLKYSLQNNEGPPGPNHKENQEIDKIAVFANKEDEENDTDSSMNRRTKDSILSRMASMGHSVLPPHDISVERTSDSSDTNTTDDHPKTTRHKPVKNIIRRINTEKTTSETLDVVGTQKLMASKGEPSVDTHPFYAQVDGKLVPVTNTSIISSSEFNRGNDMSMFISEQRIANSELRINMNRITDKVDQVLDRIKQSENTDKSNSASIFQIDILQKLLSEYENKIRFYEDIMNSKNISIGQPLTSVLNNSKESQSEVEQHRKTILNLEKDIDEKKFEIIKLNDKINNLQEKQNEVVIKQIMREDELLKQIKDLKQALIVKNGELESFSMNSNEKVPSNIFENAAEMESKLKNIMNDTFRSISVNFENSNNYSGESVKNIVATVIKKITLESLQ